MTYQSAIKQGFTRLAQIANELKNEIGKKQNTLPEAPAPSQSTSYLASDLTWKVIPEGLDGVNGQDGLNGTDGPSAYDVAVSEGFTGTRAEWVESLLPKDLVVYDWAMTNPSDVGFTPISGTYISNNTLLPSGGDTLPVIPALGPYTLANADALPTKLKISVPTDPLGIFLIGVQPSGMHVIDDTNVLYTGQNVSGFILSLYTFGQDTYQISSFTPELYAQATEGVIINGEVTLNFSNGVLTIDGYDGFEYLYNETDNLSICSVDQSGLSLEPPALTFVATGGDSSAVLPDGWFDGIVYRVTSAGIFNNKQTVVGDFVTVIDNGSDIIVTSSSIMNIKLSLEDEITARKTQAALETQERIAADLTEATTRQNSITTLQNSVNTQVAAVQSSNIRKLKLFTVSIVPYNYDTDSIQNTYYLQNGSWYILSRKFSTEGVNADRFQHIYQWNGNPSEFVVVPDTEFYAALDGYPELFSTPHILNVKNSLYYGRIFKDSMGWTYSIDTALAQAAGANNQPLTDLYSNPTDQVVGGYMSLDHLSRIGDVETLAQSNDIRISDMALQTDVEAVAANVETNRLSLLTKADISALATLTTLVGTKADQSYVNDQIANLVGTDGQVLASIQAISDELTNAEGILEALDQTVANRVRFDVATQALTSLQQYNARTNIGAEEIGEAARLVALVTVNSIGAATAAQGNKADTALQSGDVAPVALTGLFSSLASIPSAITQFIGLTPNDGDVLQRKSGSWINRSVSQLKADLGLSTVATSGAYSDLSGKPTIPAALVNSDGLTEGTSNLYYTATRVRSVVLTGISDAIQTAVLATDGLVQGIGKLQGQLNTVYKNISNINLRGMDLVSNGLGQLNDNTYFSYFTFDPVDKPAGIGSFTVAEGMTSSVGDEFIPVDPTRYYKLSYFMRQKVAGVQAKAYGLISPFDAEKLQVSPWHYMARPNTLTSLAVDLKAGDTTLTLVNGANWINNAGTSSHNRSAIIWNYVDGFGYAWPENTYSRNWTGADLYLDGGVNGNVITLRVPWSGATVPAGTKLSNGSSGGNYMYMGISGTVAPEVWTNYSAVFGTVHESGTLYAATTKLPMAAAYIKVGFLANRRLDNSFYQTGSRTGVGGLSIRDWSAVYDPSLASKTDITTTNALVESNRLATVANDASITLLKKVSGQSVNIYNALEKQVGQYLNSSGNGLVPGTGWGCTGFIPVIAGKSYTISSATARRAGLQFFTDTSATAVVAGSYNATTTNVTVVAPVGAKYLVVNLYSTSVTEPAWTQVEEGTVATAYQAYGSITQSPIGMASAIYKDKGRFDGGTFQKLTCTGLNGLQLVHTINCTQPASHDSSRVFNFVSTQFDSKVLHTCGDDAAPYRCNGATLGANHGYSRTRLTMSSHGKTLIDVGSVWTDGVKEWVIVTIVDTNNICVTARTDNTGIVATSGTLTHVSGATNTNTISWTAVSALQWYPMLKNHTLTVLADGKVIDPSASDSTYFDKLVITQSYELMTKSSIVEWLIARTKTSVDLTEYAAPSNISVSMQYAYNRYGNCTITTDFLATDNVTLQDIMFLQSARLTPAVDGNINYYIPKTLQLTHEDVVYDFAAKVDVSTFAPATRINFTPDRTDANGQLADRVVQLSDNYMYATGYLPILDASPAIRRTNASTKALQLNNNGAKIYMSAVDSTSITSLVAGDYFSVVGYRNYSKKSTTRTDNYMVQSGSGDYYYIDYHTATADRIQLPVELQGRAFDIVENSTTVTVLSDIATSSIAVKTTGAGYAVLKFK